MSLMQETEAQFENFSPAKRWAVIVGAALAIVVMGYLFWIEPMEGEIETEESRIAQLQRQVAQVRIRRIVHTLEKEKKERLALEEKLQKADAAKRFLQSRARRLDFIWFDQKSFLEMLDRVLARSVKLGVRIDRIETFDEDGEVTPLIEKKKSVEMEGAGGFAEIVRLVRYIESFNALLKVTRFRVGLGAEGETTFLLTLESYGAKL